MHGLRHSLIRLAMLFHLTSAFSVNSIFSLFLVLWGTSMICLAIIILSYLTWPDVSLVRYCVISPSSFWQNFCTAWSKKKKIWYLKPWRHNGTLNPYTAHNHTLSTKIHAYNHSYYYGYDHIKLRIWKSFICGVMMMQSAKIRGADGN